MTNATPTSVRTLRTPKQPHAADEQQKQAERRADPMDGDDEQRDHRDEAEALPVEDVVVDQLAEPQAAAAGGDPEREPGELRDAQRDAARRR